MRNVLFAAMLLLASSAMARAEGFSSRVAAGLLVINQADNLNGRGHATLSSLNEKPKQFTRLFPVPMVELRYAWEGNSVYFGSPPDEPVALNLGYRRRLEKGAMSVSAFYSFFGREWQNPYLVGTPRSETRVNSYGGRLAFEDIGGSPFTLAVKGTVKSVVDEGLTGDLRRDGTQLDVDLSWQYRLSEGWTMVPQAGYRRGEYLGAANSFHGASLGLGANWQSGDLLIATRLTGTLASYDQVHPVFTTTRRDLGYRFSSMARLGNPFGWRNYNATAGIIHQWTGSNIDFFESRSLIGIAAFGYQF